MNASTIKYQILKLDTHLDCAEFFLCPSCAGEIIRLVDGCSLCGWCDEDDLLGGNEKNPRKSSSTFRGEFYLPCLIKQPKQPETKGIIKQDLGDCFLVEVDGKDTLISKLFVYPDFSTQRASDKSVEQIEKSPRKNITPSKGNSRKRCDPASAQDALGSAPRNRRKKGQGNGTIYYRTVTKKGKEYREAYYHYIENGKKRTKYIPKKLLDRVEEAEFRKLPVSDILILLGGDKKNPRKSSSTLTTCIDEKLNDGCIEQVLEANDLNPRKTTPPSTKRRKQGYGGGYIECKPIIRSGKQYKQYWYHYEFWSDGDRTTKKSCYIPKRLVQKIERMNRDKVAVKRILEIFQSKRKK